MAKTREIEVFGLSFMDLISCGLGGMLVLMFVFSTLVNVKGVANPSKAEAAGKTVAELERDMIFNTHFVLKIYLDKAGVEIIPANHTDIIQSVGKKREGSGMEHILMVYGTNKVVDKMTFSLSGPTTGQVKLLGEKALAIKENISEVQVIKDKTNYKIKLK